MADHLFHLKRSGSTSSLASIAGIPHATSGGGGAIKLDVRYVRCFHFLFLPSLPFRGAKPSQGPTTTQNRNPRLHHQVYSTMHAAIDSSYACGCTRLLYVLLSSFPLLSS